MTLEEEIAAEAVRLGFAAAGIAAAGPSQTMDIFDSWLADGMAGQMAFLARRRYIRTDVRNLHPDARSVIVVASRYPANPSPGTGFAAHACGRDYHSVFRERLKLLSEFVTSRTGSSGHRICVDSAPLPEREWAARAGIGWIGKQGQVISPDAGCCILLGELLVDLDLQPSPGVEPRCRSCRLCIDACPTGALREDGRVDARVCISYLTIEYHGAIPPPLAKKMGGALFGCDCCTAACPWSRMTGATVARELAGRAMPTAAECLAMTADEFQSRFRDSAVLRTGQERLRRNAGIAIANLSNMDTEVGCRSHD